jgi:hypothetical protein
VAEGNNAGRLVLVEHAGHVEDKLKQNIADAPSFRTLTHVKRKDYKRNVEEIVEWASF